MLKTFALTFFILFLSVPALAQDLGFQKAAKMYQVDSFTLRSISYVESRFNVKAVNSNDNGSKDLGHMQINNIVWAKHLNGNYEKLDDYPQYCTQVGAWILRQCVNRYPSNVWEQVACYHTGIGYTDAKRLGDAIKGNSKQDIKNRNKWRNKEYYGLIYANKIYDAMTLLIKLNSDSE